MLAYKKGKRRISLDLPKAVEKKRGIKWKGGGYMGEKKSPLTSIPREDITIL